MERSKRKRERGGRDDHKPERKYDPMTWVITDEAREAEMTLLGIMIRDGDAQDGVAVEIGNGDPFNVAEHSAIWGAMKAIRRETGEPVDSYQITAQFDATNRLPDIGGKPMLIELWERGFSPATWPHYWRLVLNAWKRRTIQMASATAVHRLKEGAETDDVCDDLATELAQARANAFASLQADKGKETAALLAALEKRETRVITTGLGAFDDQFGGYPLGGVTTIFGAPGSAKSSLAAALMLRLAKSGTRGAIFSYEMNAETQIAHLIANEAQVDIESTRTRGRPMTDGDYMAAVKAANVIIGAPIEFIDKALNASDFERTAIGLIGRGYRAFCLDYIQNVHTDGEENEYERISIVCRAAQRISRQYGATVVLVSQIRSEAAREDREPRSSDIVGAGTVEQVSDMMIGTHRPCRLKPRSSSEPDALWEQRRLACRLIVAKNKNGQTGAVSAQFEGKFFKFSDAPDHVPEGDLYVETDSSGHGLPV